MKRSGKNTPSDLSPEQLNERGKKLFDRGQIKEATKYLEKAVSLDEKFYEGWFNLGLMYQKQNRLKKAIKCYKKNINIYAQNPMAMNNMAFCYGLLGEVKKSLEIVKILSRQGEGWEMYFNLGTTSQVAGKAAQAIKYYKRSIELNPDYPITYGQLHDNYTRICAWDKAERLVPKLDKLNKIAIDKGEIPAEMPFANISRQENSKVNFEIAKLKNIQHIQENAKASLVRFVFNKRQVTSSQIIKVGYLSADYHDHATVHLIQGVLESHNRKGFKIYAYSHGKRDNSKYRKAVIKAVDEFKDISTMSDRNAGIEIFKDEIDILVDLKGHTNGNRLEIMALKPAPIQVSWLGYPGTVGGDYIDYIVADKIVLPREQRKFYSEKAIYLPDTYQPNDDRQVISDKKYERRDFDLPKNAITFSSFNQPYKITKQTFTSWMRILKKVPNSVLWLYEKQKLAFTNQRKKAQELGVDPKRLVLAVRLPKDEHLKRLSLSDLALDTFTYNGHTTTSDCLWAGVPVITKKGKHFASRVSASLLTAVGLPELITNSAEDYEKLAIDLATNPKKLKVISHKLLVNKGKMPLFNTKRFTKNLEKAYEEIFKIYKTGNKPKHIVIH